MFTCAPVLTSPPWSPRHLFGAGEQGAWYDPSDMGSMCRDPQGCLPVFAANNTVGLMLDKRYGLRTTTEILGVSSRGGPFTTTGSWVTTSSATVVSVVDGEIRARLTTSGSTWSLRLPSQSLVGGVTYKIAFTVRQSATFAQGGLALSIYNQTTSTSVGTTAYTQMLVGGDLVAYFTPPASGSFSLIIAGSNNEADFGKDIFLTKASCAVLPGNHLQQSASASRPTLRYASATGLWYLEFDGVDDFLLSATAIDFTATNKMSLFAGLRKNSDAAFGTVAELSVNLATNPGTFTIRAPNGAAPDYQVNWSGSTVKTANIGSLAAPNTSILTSTADIGTSDVAMRINGSAAGIVLSGALGTGNFSSNPLYVGRRAGTSSAFAGYLYGLIIRGAATDEVTMATVEKYLANKSGVAL